ncbi:MAG: class I adenylate-forming enzyme family protein [Verrucomicrobiota bacterium]
MTADSDPLLRAWETVRRRRGEHSAILDARGEVARTFSGVEARAQLLGAELEEFAPGEVIALQPGNHPDWPSLLLACLRRQLVALPLERSLSDDERDRIMALCDARAVFSLLHGCKGNQIVLLRQSGRPRTNSNRWGELRPTLLKATSGTTAAPRLIRFRSSQLLADCESICDTMALQATDVNYGVIPVSHSYGFSSLLLPLLARGVTLALNSDRIPRSIVDGLAATRATVFAGMPVFYQSLCDLPKPPPLPALRLCLSAGAPLTADLADRFQACYGLDIHSFYGSSECGGICYARTPKNTPGYVGAAMKGVRIEVCEQQGTGTRIRVRSAAVGDGYFPEPDEQKLGQGAFLPDDLLELGGEGYRIVGRVSDLINVAGKKVNPAEVEAEILRYAGVRETVVFGRRSERRNEEVVACVVATAAVREADLLGHCRMRLSSWQVPRQIYFLEQLPINERGKISRRDLSDRFAHPSES